MTPMDDRPSARVEEMLTTIRDHLADVRQESAYHRARLEEVFRLVESQARAVEGVVMRIAAIERSDAERTTRLEEKLRSNDIERVAFEKRLSEIRSLATRTSDEVAEARAKAAGVAFAVSAIASAVVWIFQILIHR